MCASIFPRTKLVSALPLNSLQINKTDFIATVYIIERLLNINKMDIEGQFKGAKVTVIGAAGGIGQPLSLMLKANFKVGKLSLYDVSETVSGVAMDLSHIDTPAHIEWFTPKNGGLKKALTGSEYVLVPAGVPRKPGMSRNDLFKINAGICAELATAIAEFSPNATTLVISNPVNSTVPVFVEILKRHGVFNARKLFGVTTLDSVRADTFLHRIKPEMKWGLIRVVGGHSGDTIVPLLSTVLGTEMNKVPRGKIQAVVHHTQYGGDEVIKAKNGGGSSTLSMAYAANKFFCTVLNGRDQFSKDHVGCTYVCLEDESINGVSELKDILRTFKKDQNLDMKYFAIPCVFGQHGIERVMYECLEKLHPYEKEMVEICCDSLPGNYEKGLEFTRTY